MTPDQLIEEKAKSTADINLRGLAEDRLISWHTKYERKAPGVALNVFKATKSFFKANYLPLGCKIPTYVKQREEDYIPTTPEVKAMCELANLETATFILFAAESGQRDGTVADLNLSHAQGCLNGEPYVFIIPQKRDAKTGKIVKSKRIYGQYGFLCQDAVEKLKLLIKTKNLKPEDKIFGCEVQTYSKAITDLAIKIGIAEPTGLRRFKTHNLRKRAQIILEDSGVPLNWVDRILGHKPRGSQADAYSLPPKEKLAEKYKLAMPALSVFGEEKATSDELKELKERVAKLEAKFA